MVNLFVYGTLMIPEKVKQITGNIFLAEDATIKGYKRFFVRDFDYPAIVKCKNEVVHGFLLKNVDKKSFEKIVGYEGSQYKTENVIVYSRNERTKALVFVWNDALSLLDEKDWDVNSFNHKES